MRPGPARCDQGRGHRKTRNRRPRSVTSRSSFAPPRSATFCERTFSGETRLITSGAQRGVCVARARDGGFRRIAATPGVRGVAVYDHDLPRRCSQQGSHSFLWR